MSVCMCVCASACVYMCAHVYMGDVRSKCRIVGASVFVCMCTTRSCCLKKQPFLLCAAVTQYTK